MQQFSQKRFTSLVSSSKKEIDKSINLAKKDVREMLMSCISGEGSFLVGERPSKSCPLDFLRALSEWHRNSFIDMSIRNIIISSLFSSETKQGGSGLISAMMMLDDVEVVEKKSKCSESDIEKIINDWSPQGISNKIAKEVFYMGGCGSEVKILESDSFASRIKCTSGVVQLCSIAGGFSNKNLSDLSIDRLSYVVAIDGFVEKISQIHHLLENLGEQQLILMAKGFLPDVVNTLSVNYPDNIKCVPVVVEDWCISSFLDLEKMEISCVSSEAGMEISSAKLSKLISVSVDVEGIIFENGDFRNGRKIYVELGKDLGDLKGLTTDRIKTLVTLSRFTSRRGMTKIKYKNHEIHVPTSSYEAAARCKKSMENIFQEIGGIIAIQKRGEIFG